MRRLGHFFIRNGVLVFTLTAAIYVPLAIAYSVNVDTAGDEPIYLLTTHSLATDGDLDIGNNLARRDYYPTLYKGVLSVRDASPSAKGDSLFAAAPPGLPLIAAAPYWIGLGVGHGREFVATFIALIAALTAVQIYMLACWATRDHLALFPIDKDRPIAILTAIIPWIAWACLALAMPLAGAATQFYPDVVMALIVAWLLRRVLERSIVRHWQFALCGVVIGSMPWLNAKNIVLVPVFCFLFAVRQMVEPAPRGASGSRLVALLSPVFFLVTALVLANQAMFGVASLTGGVSSYGVLYPWTAAPNVTAMATELVGGLSLSSWGLLLDYKEGLLLYSPIYLVAIGGIAFSAKRHRFAVLAITLVAGVLYAGTMLSSVWWKGGLGGFPNRYILPALPLAAVPLAWLITEALAYRNSLRLLILIPLSAWGWVSFLVFVVDQESWVWRSTAAVYDWQFALPNSRVILDVGLHVAYGAAQAQLGAGWFLLSFATLLLIAPAAMNARVGRTGVHAAGAVTCLVALVLIASALPNSRAGFLAEANRSLRVIDYAGPASDVAQDARSGEASLRIERPGWAFLYGADQFPSGTYVVRFFIACDQAAIATTPLSTVSTPLTLTFQVVSNLGRNVLAEEYLPIDASCDPDVPEELIFGSRAEPKVEIRVFSHGQRRFWLEKVTVTRSQP